MIVFQTPLWLLLLGLLPLIRWLHRFSSPPGIMATTTLFLWSKQRRRIAPGGSRAEPDRRWLLRAAIFASMILALAGPGLPGSDKLSADVWVDDSLSMFTREQGQSRMQAALQELQAHLGDQDYSRIRLISLGDPASVLSLDADNRSTWAAELAAWTDRPRAEPSPPAAASLSPGRRHILLTDGADQALNRWAETAPLARIIRTGRQGGNLALSGLALRAPLGASEIIQATVRVDNPGDTGSELRLVLERGNRVIDSAELTLPPGGNHVAAFAIAAGKVDGPLEARLRADNDALPLDDSLQIDMAQLHAAIGYRLHGECAPGVLALLDSQPALAPAAGDDASLSIYCNGNADDPVLPALVLHPANATLRSTQRGHWHRQLAIGSLPIGAGAAYDERAPLLASAGIPILSADGRILIGRDRDSKKIINVYLDLADPTFRREPQYPLLILGLIGELSGHELDAAPVSRGREPQASRIRPLPLSTADAPPARPQAGSIELRSPIIALLLLLLLADAVPTLRSAAGRAAR